MGATEAMASLTDTIETFLIGMAVIFGLSQALTSNYRKYSVLIRAGAFCLLYIWAMIVSRLH